MRLEILVVFYFIILQSYSLNLNFPGIGGHGGSGIHADLDDKYREIVARTSVHTAARTPRPFVSLSPSTANDAAAPKSASSRQVSAVRYEAAATTSGPVGGLSRYDRDVRRSNRTNDAAAAAAAADGDDTAQGQGGRRVEQVHVPKCTVCTIL